jgi:heterodisulfide reductase subunit C
MDFSPRRIVALVREGFRKDALSSKTIWLCASCYSCAVHCPRQIHIADVMYGLKREAIQDRLYPARFPIPVLAQEFYKMASLAESVGGFRFR